MSWFRRKNRDDDSFEKKNEFANIHPQDIQHHALYSTLNSNYLAPIKGLLTRTILDIGCGTGTWGREIKREFPDARITGFDLLAAPSNAGNTMASYIQGNLLQGLPFATNSFTYVHQRALVGTIPLTSWPFVAGEMVRVTRPGGWIELVEAGSTSFNPQGPSSARLIEGILKINAIHGVDLRVVSTLDQILRQAGLTNIYQQTVPVPLGNWDGDTGILMGKEILLLAESYRDPFIKLLRHSPADFDSLITTLTQEWNDYHTRYLFYFLVGQKPLLA